MPLLEVNGVNLSFGGLRAIQNLSFEVEDQEIVSLIGPNGAGKSTALNVLTGIYPPDSGEIRYRGTSLLGLKPHAITALGVARTFQTLRVFLNLSVIENVMTGAYCHSHSSLLATALRLPSWRREEMRIRSLAEKNLAFFGDRLMGYRHDQPAYSLSYANRRRLEIARAMTTGATLLLLDEPAAGMNPNESAEMTELIGKLRDEAGYTILLIEHDMNVVGNISDRVIALDYGQKIAEGTFESVTSDPKVIEAYLGHQTGGEA
ncbi:MAG: ABC transporter ATP-binding protein [Trueperaceae bacterium]|nr:MAG: ABC transporter ATP-binding protein [Trueperaceae bacterium]